MNFLKVDQFLNNETKHCSSGPYFRIITVCLNAGKVHGITIGSKFAVYSLDDERKDDGDHYALVEVVEIGATKCIANLLPEANSNVGTFATGSVGIGCKAYEMYHVHDHLCMATTIVMPMEMIKSMESIGHVDETPLAVQRLFNKLKFFIDNSPLFKWSETTEGVDCILDLIVPPFNELSSHPAYCVCSNILNLSDFFRFSKSLQNEFNL